MEIVFTVALIFIAYILTVNEKYRRKIDRHENKIFELEQLVNISLIYGKKEKEK